MVIAVLKGILAFFSKGNVSESTRKMLRGGKWNGVCSHDHDQKCNI
uniref:Uncharacterized protein n=1 Tax=Anguilla anguilla TaxID=7936 RepID=A0A0E9QI75_ANGAN